MEKSLQTLSGTEEEIAKRSRRDISVTPFVSHSSSKSFRVANGESSVSWLCPQSSMFKSCPHTMQRPLQSGSCNGLMGISSRAYSRIRGAKSICASSGTSNSDSLTDFLVKAYNSVNSHVIGCVNSFRHRTHSRVVSAENFP